MLQQIIASNSKLRQGLSSGNLKNEHSLHLMRSYLAALGITQEDFQRLRIIHVAGTKGKGSTCAFLERLFRASGKRTGLFTSPHLTSPTERIRVDGIDLPETEFASAFFHVHDTLIAAQIPLPGFFPFLTLMAFHTFKQHSLDVAIMEVGIGGRFDSTNVIDKPAVCVIAALALEHTDVLGNTIESIAWHKAGIIKDKCITITTKQEHSGLVKICEESQAKLAPLKIITEPLSSLDWPESENAALALEAYQQWHNLYNDASLLDPFSAEAILATTKIPGRKHIINDDCGTTWYLDGAHTVESLQTVSTWIAKVCNPQEATLLFFCTPDRDWDSLYSTMSHHGFKKVFFVYPESYSHYYENKQLSFKGQPIIPFKEWLDDFDQSYTKEVVVTGSFYIVGDAMLYLRRQPSAITIPCKDKEMFLEA